MTFAEYQAAAARTINPALTAEQRLFDASAGLAEEAGETLALVRKHLFQHHPLDRDRVLKELGDALWCLTTVASMLDLSLDAVAESNLAKLRDRYPDGFNVEASRRRPD
jgi:NTP pyrophosphatase (non-canonical NTP hydrolase)